MSHDIPDESDLTYPASTTHTSLDLAKKLNDQVKITIRHQSDHRKIVFRLKWALKEDDPEVMTDAVAFETKTVQAPFNLIKCL